MKRSIILSLLIAFVFSATVSAQDYISVAELAKIYKQKEVVVIFAGKATVYKKEHIPFSINIYHGDLNKVGGVKSVLNTSAVVGRILGAKGVAKDAQIIVYDKGTSKYAGRMYWILKYYGATNVKMLNGNLKAWKAARKPVTATAAKKKAKTFTPSVKSAYAATMADVKAAQKDANTLIVDVRPKSEFNGETGTTTRKGHIPGAINFHFADVLAVNGTFKTSTQIAAIAKARGISSNKKIILYCTSSVRAGVVFMAFKTILKYPNVKVYDGAFYEWESKVANKVD